jgi:glycosyltransferase involved in cell wall biosynthesis
MTNELLTIIVPTYNRAEQLSVLLTALRSELQGLESIVKVLVSDNASTDSTPEVAAYASRDWPALTIQRHDRNLGPDGNFLSCISCISTRYFWIIGDDDCPKRGVLAKIVQLLTDRKPALVYMQSDWVNEIKGPGEAIGDLWISDLPAQRFAEAIHVWFTFISGMVIDRERLLNVLGEHSIDRFNATSLVQLGWVLPLLTTTGPFLYIKTACIFATKGNSGGYNALKVFGNNFQNIIKTFFGDLNGLSQFSDSMIFRTNLYYLPGLIRAYKKGTIGKFDRDFNIEDAFDPDLLKSLFYRLILKPIYGDSEIKRLVAYVAARVASGVLNHYDNFVIFYAPMIFKGLMQAKNKFQNDN